MQLSVCLSGGFVTAPRGVSIPAHLLWMNHGQPCEEEEGGGRGVDEDCEEEEDEGSDEV